MEQTSKFNREEPMPCPFPGMDPYIERPAIWGDFQWSYTVRLSSALQPLLRPKYASMISRLYSDEEAFQLELHIVEPRDIYRVVTAIQVLTPDNKRPGPLRVVYLNQRDHYLEKGANLVEIDLLLCGLPIVRGRHGQNEPLSPHRYSITVSRNPDRQELCNFPLSASLPIIAVPLANDDKDVPLDLQAAFAGTWDEGPYPELLHYHAPPPGELSADEHR